MPETDERIDAYIEKSQDFAKPILRKIRALIHEACPEVNETIKWSFPNFEYKGILCSMAGFKEHCTFGFWKQSIMKDSGFFAKNRETEGGMGILGKISSLEDLPPDEKMLSLIREACRLNDEGIKLPPRPKAAAPKELVVPEVLLAALAASEKASETFESFPYSAKKEYVEWIAEARTEATQAKRLATTIEWLTEGKRRNWKYESC